MDVPPNTPDQLIKEAMTWYARLRPVLEPAHDRKFLVINLDTGDYELDPNDLVASQRARTRFGPSARLMTLRVGQTAAYRLGSVTQGRRAC